MKKKNKNKKRVAERRSQNWRSTILMQAVTMLNRSGSYLTASNLVLILEVELLWLLPREFRASKVSTKCSLCVNWLLESQVSHNDTWLQVEV